MNGARSRAKPETGRMADLTPGMFASPVVKEIFGTAPQQREGPHCRKTLAFFQFRNYIFPFT